jgi:hypothetical protein
MLACVLPALRQGAAQTAGASGRTPWGAPNLQGVWDFGVATPVERPAELGDRAFFTEEEAAEFERLLPERFEAQRQRNLGDRDVGNETWPGGPPQQLTEDRRTSQIVEPADGRLPPMTPSAQAQAAMRRPGDRPVRDLVTRLPVLNGPEDLGLSERCIFMYGPPFVGWASYLSVLQILQTPGSVAIVVENMHDTRIIPLDDRPHLSPAIRQYQGDSRGHWEGDTLVVTTTNFTGRLASFAGQGFAHGSAEHRRVTERFTRAAADTLIYEYTVDDPVTFTRPFTVRISMRPAEGRVHEYACHEGNAAMINTLTGARLDDAR